MSLLDAASSGDHLRALQELRDLLARRIESTDSGRDTAALSRQLADVLSQIAALSPTTEVDRVDEIAARRSARRAGAAKTASRAKRSG